MPRHPVIERDHRARQAGPVEAGEHRRGEAGKVDLDEIVTIIARYADREIDFADATLVWLAELVNTLDVMTIDRRDFQVYRPRSGKAFNLVLS
ncbi:MAG TPA: hypothetical protein VGV06_16445 [Methylomirabilota bacterium]|nr:hypothetical protein [Methylomirabilota bacterium]